MASLIYFGEFLWGIVLIASFAGYGTIIGRLLMKYRFQDDGVAIALGLSFVIVLGGFLNLVRVISAPLIVGLVLAGVVIWVASGGVAKLLVAGKRLRGWDYAILAVLLLGYVNWLCYSQRLEPGKEIPSHALYISDDSAYTLFPTRMLQTGGMGIDPFSDRLTVSALGGEFLQAMVLALLPIEYIHLADPGLAYLAMGVIFLTMRRLTGPARFMLAAIFAAHPTASINASAVAVPVVLLVAMSRVLTRDRATTDIVRSSAGVALLLAALMTLKSTLIPGSVLVVVFWGVILAVTIRRFRPLAIVVVTGLFTLLLLLPWMVCSYWSGGTLLYPLLGAGFRQAMFTTAAPTTDYWSRAALIKTCVKLISSPQTLVLLTGCVGASVYVCVRRTPCSYRAVLFAGCAASLLCMGLYAVVFRVDMMWRYFYPYAAFTNFIAYGTLLRLARSRERGDPSGLLPTSGLLFSSCSTG